MKSNINNNTSSIIELRQQVDSLTASNEYLQNTLQMATAEYEESQSSYFKEMDRLKDENRALRVREIAIQANTKTSAPSVEPIMEAQAIDAFSSSLEVDNKRLRAQLNAVLADREELAASLNELNRRPFMVDQAVQVSMPKPSKILMPNDIKCPNGPFTNLEYKRLYIDSEERLSHGVIQRIVKTVPKKFGFEQTFIDTYYPAQHPKYYNQYPISMRHELRESKCCTSDCCTIS